MPKQKLSEHTVAAHPQGCSCGSPECPQLQCDQAGCTYEAYHAHKEHKEPKPSLYFVTPLICDFCEGRGCDWCGGKGEI